MSRKLIKRLDEGVKVYRDSEWDEFVVEHPTNPDAAYFTDDKDDAFGTAQMFVKEIKEQAQ